MLFEFEVRLLNGCFFITRDLRVQTVAAFFPLPEPSGIESGKMHAVLAHLLSSK